MTRLPNGIDDPKDMHSVCEYYQAHIEFKTNILKKEIADNNFYAAEKTAETILGMIRSAEGKTEKLAGLDSKSLNPGLMSKA